MRAASPSPCRGTGVEGAAGGGSRLRFLLLLSGAFLAVQVLMTEYGAGRQGVAGLWFVLGCLLLWVVYRGRSRAARGVVIVTSLVGAVICGLGTLEDAHAGMLALTYLGQALPLIVGPVRRHVGVGTGQPAAH